MEDLETILIISLIITLFLAISYIIIYNIIIKAKNKIDESLSSVEVHLKLRYDLIPNLVNTVKGYAKHEKEIFEELIKARYYYENSKNIKQKINLSNEAYNNLTRLIALKENYPDLKADKAFKKIMRSLNIVEEKISAARRFYNAAVNSYNNKIQVFPNKIIKNIHKFEQAEYFKIDVSEIELVI